MSQLLQEKLEGFVHLSIREPMRNHGFERLAWANFSNEHDTSQALLKIEGLQINEFRLSAARSHPNKKKTPIRITPPLPAKQIEYDLKICQRLIKNVFDPEKQIESTIVDQIMSKDISDMLKLDLLLLYLRRVHAYCLYCGEEFEDERMLSTRCGPQHIRNSQKIPQEEFDDILSKNVPVEKQEET